VIIEDEQFACFAQPAACDRRKKFLDYLGEPGKVPASCVEIKNFTNKWYFEKKREPTWRPLTTKYPDVWCRAAMQPFRLS